MALPTSGFPTFPSRLLLTWQQLAKAEIDDAVRMRLESRSLRPVSQNAPRAAS